jgi:hypothetical protein
MACSYVARVVNADAFRRAGLDRRLRNEGGDLAVLDAANADAKVGPLFAASTSGIMPTSSAA